MALTLRRETGPGDPSPAYVVLSDGNRIGRVLKQDNAWTTEPSTGEHESRESAVFSLATGKE
jgi:hypothetical protein